MKRLTYDEIKLERLEEGLAASTENRFPVIAIIDNVRSLYNVGSIFRTSDAARLEAIYTVGYTPHPPRPEIEKTALGATRTVPSKHFNSIEEAILACKNLGMQVGALELTDNARSVYDLTEENFPLALVVGNEITGVSHEALAMCDLSIAIPMIGAKHSLNVAVAYGIAVFECVRVFSGQLTKFRPE
jgi:23S rRNA (guanosine2251-2'-O)-methyltransferase